MGMFNEITYQFLGRKHSFVVRIAGEKYEKHSFDPLIQKLKILEKNANLERGTRSPFSILWLHISEFIIDFFYFLFYYYRFLGY